MKDRELESALAKWQSQTDRANEQVEIVAMAMLGAASWSAAKKLGIWNEARLQSRAITAISENPFGHFSPAIAENVYSGVPDLLATAALTVAVLAHRISRM